jgi:hypothetical protein
MSKETEIGQTVFVQFYRLDFETSQVNFSLPTTNQQISSAPTS